MKFPVLFWGRQRLALNPPPPFYPTSQRIVIDYQLETNMKRKNYLDNTKKEFTEADMWQFALDYMERFQFDLMANGCVDKNKVDKFLTKNIEKYRDNNEPLLK